MTMQSEDDYYCYKFIYTIQVIKLWTKSQSMWIMFCFDYDLICDISHHNPHYKDLFKKWLRKYDFDLKALF